VTARLAVLVSGSGTLLQALIDASGPDFTIAGVISDRPDAYGLQRAESAGISTDVVAPGRYQDRDAWNEHLASVLEGLQVDWIVCAGFMRILGPQVLHRFSGRIINSHPALLPAFPGAHGVRDALEYGVRVTGCTVHLVDGGVDTGPILAQEPVTIDPHDDEEALHERIKVVERRLLVHTVRDVCRYGCTMDGRRVTIP
jgi:phosphoribosylglycinamide formyltransferase 1